MTRTGSQGYSLRGEFKSVGACVVTFMDSCGDLRVDLHMDLHMDLRIDLRGAVDVT